VRVLLENIPHVRQKPDFCGEACAEMALAWKGRPETQDDVFDASGVAPTLGRGAWTPELKTALEKLGFEVGEVWHRFASARAPAELEAQLKALYDDLARGVPSIVCMHYADGPRTTEHFRLVVGYDPESDELVYHEPAEDHGGYRRMKRATFLRRWPLKYTDAAWTVIRFALDPTGKVAPPAPHPAGGARPAEYAQHVMALRKKLGEGFTYFIDAPFVIAGDEPEEMVAQRAANTVRWAKQKLEEDFFAKEPAHILDVLLFDGSRSYRRHAIDLFGKDPSTPYGYYTPEHRALVMDIATGGGTLVHEMVHPFVEADFPDAPAWLNEGLGSLFEQSDERDGHIVGLPNWRLPGLQRAIVEHRVVPLDRLVGTDTQTFYADESGLHYAMARYLCFYLQERGALVRFYRDFRAHAAEDPTGIEALRRALGERDLAAFQPRWEAFVMKLHFVR
jgi:hypothetical protein